jgi:hypothetical protein
MYTSKKQACGVYVKIIVIIEICEVFVNITEIF